MESLSLWGAVANRYAEPQELRVGELTGRFEVRFEAATLMIRKSNGVERAIDFDEFRAAWRTLAAGGEDVTLRLVTANGAYLRAIRSDLLEHGVKPDAEAEPVDDEDISTAERHLLSEATRLSRPAVAGSSEPAGGPASVAAPVSETAVAVDDTVDAIKRQLEAERSDKEAALRENARLVAFIETLEHQLRLESERAIELEGAVARLKSAPAQKPVGVGGDVSLSLADAASKLIDTSSAPDELRKAARIAIKLVHQDPPSAVTKARVVTELLVKQEWGEVFAADPSETRKLFGDYARELDGQPGVDAKMLAVKRTLYRVASPGAHELQVSARRSAMVVLVLAGVLSAYRPRS